MPGKVIIQTYNPDNFAIQLSKEQNYDLFYKTEINLRQQMNYPPFSDIIVIGFSGENLKKVAWLSNMVYNLICLNLKKYNISVFKPMPAPIDKIKNQYRWRIIAKGSATEEAVIVINKCLKKVYDTRAGDDVKLSVDVNPNNMM